MLASDKGPVMGVDRFHKPSPVKSRLNFNEKSADEDSTIFNTALRRETDTNILPKIHGSALKTSPGTKRDRLHLSGQSRIKRTPLPLEAINQFMNATTGHTLKEKLKANMTRQILDGSLTLPQRFGTSPSLMNKIKNPRRKSPSPPELPERSNQ